MGQHMDKHDIFHWNIAWNTDITCMVLSKCGNLPTPDGNDEEIVNTRAEMLICFPIFHGA